MFGFGPFSDDSAIAGGREARKLVNEQFRSCGEDRQAFRDWLAHRIGVWVDYCCMPQEPLSPEEEVEFRRSLRALDSLVRSSTVVALRQANDDYAVRGWCAAEFFLASGRSFSRGLFFDMSRLEKRQDVLVPSDPTSEGTDSGVAEVMRDSYRLDVSAFREACEVWRSFEGPLLEVTPPDPWSAYRSLQGSGFFSPELDPNPFRRALEAIRSLETVLIGQWLMAEKPHTFDLGNAAGRLMQRFGMYCSKESDLIYLGFLLACNGWIAAFRPLFRECLRRYLEGHRIQGPPAVPESVPVLPVTLMPLDGDVRSLFWEVDPASAGTWHSRLTSRSGAKPQEAAVIQQLREALELQSPEFVFVDPAHPSRSRFPIESLP